MARAVRRVQEAGGATRTRVRDGDGPPRGGSARLPARTVAIPRRTKIPATRRAIEHARGSRRLVKWRDGSEGRISYLKHRYGWDRTRLDGREGASIWWGHGVFAHNMGKISQPQLAAATRLGLSPPTFSGRSNLIGGSARGYQPGLRIVDLLAAAVTDHRTSHPQTARYASALSVRMSESAARTEHPWMRWRWRPGPSCTPHGARHP
jgi:hypothetical protein